MYTFNLSLYNRITNSNIDINEDAEVFKNLDYNNIFNLFKIWIKKQGFSIITIFEPNVDDISVFIINNYANGINNEKFILSFNSFNKDEKQAIFNVANDLFLHLNSNKHNQNLIKYIEVKDLIKNHLNKQAPTPIIIVVNDEVKNLLDFDFKNHLELLNKYDDEKLFREGRKWGLKVFKIYTYFEFNKIEDNKEIIFNSEVIKK